MFHSQLLLFLPRDPTPLMIFPVLPNMAHTRQSRPDSGLGLQVEVLHTVEAVLTSLGGQVGRDKRNDDRETPFVDVARK